MMERVTEPAEKSIDDAITRTLEAMSLNPLKPKQLETVRTFMSGRDTFVSLQLVTENLLSMLFFHLHLIGQ